MFGMDWLLPILQLLVLGILTKTTMFCTAYVHIPYYASYPQQYQHQTACLSSSTCTRRSAAALGISTRMTFSRKRQRSSLQRRYFYGHLSQASGDDDDTDDDDTHHNVDDEETTAKTILTHDGAAASSSNTTTLQRLESMGWDAHFQNQLIRRNETNSIPVRVIEVRSNGLRVVGPELLPLVDQILIPPSSSRKRNNVVVGDWIMLTSTTTTTTTDHDSRHDNDNHQPMTIHRLLERKSLLQRRAPGPSRKVQLIAANLDTVFLVSSFNQDFNVARLERYIAMALEANVSPVILLTKRDVYEDVADVADAIDDDTDDDDTDTAAAAAAASEDVTAMLDSYVHDAEAISAAVPVVVLDARGDEPATKLAQWCRPGKTVAFLGSSGVGKSTLVNSLCGEQVAATAAIHLDSGQGRHTTTRRQLFFLPNGCSIIDTPGLRELQLLDVPHGLAEVFSDLVELSAQCRFNDCRHDGEPGCAVELAVEQGVVDGDRVARWQKLVAEDQINSKTMVESNVKLLQKQMRQKQAKKKKRNK